VLKDKAMLVSLHIATWTARKLDKRVTREVHEKHEASEKAGRYTKHLLEGAEKLEAIEKLRSEIRNYYYSMTLPWTDDGRRVLASSSYYEFRTQMNVYMEQFKVLVQDFFAAYPFYQENARLFLKGLWNLNDYPEIDKLVKKFDVKVSIDAITAGEDFRVSLGDDEQERVRREIDDQYKESVHSGMSELWGRLQAAVLRLTNILASPKARFHQTTIPNVADVANMVPKLNITGEQALNDLAKEALDRLATLNREHLLDHPVARAAAAGVANDVLGKIASAMRARGYDVDMTKTLAEIAMEEEAANELASADENEFPILSTPIFQPSIPGLQLVDAAAPQSAVPVAATPTVEEMVAKMEDYLLAS
jgi:hypothetical protein